MGGIAMRAPVLAALFLIVTLATLAMPGLGELHRRVLILLGVFQAKIVDRVRRRRSASRWRPSTRCASTSRSMHNRVGPRRRVARDQPARRRSCSCRCVLVILALALYPQFALKRGERRGRAARSRRRSSRRSSSRSSPRRRPAGRRAMSAADRRRSSAPRTSTTPGSRRSSRCSAASCVVLLAGLLRPRAARAAARAGPQRSSRSRAASGCAIWQWDERSDAGRGRAARSTTLDAARSTLIVVRRRRSRRSLLAGATARPREVAHGEFHALLLGSVARHGRARRGAEPGHVLRRPRAALDPALRPLRARRCAASSSLESGLKYLIIGSLGSATLLYGLALHLRRAPARPTSPAIAAAARRRGPRRRPAGADRHRAGGRRPRLQGLGRAVPPVDARRLRGRADAGHRVHGGRDQGRRVRASSSASSTSRCCRPSTTGSRRWRRSRSISIVVGNVGALGQDSLKRMLGYSGDRPGRLHAGRRRRRARELGVKRARLLPRRLPLMNLAAFAVDRRCASARRALRRRHRARSRASAPSARCWRWPLTIAMLAPRRPPGDRGLHRQALPDRGRRRRRLHLARRRDRDRLDDLARLLPAGGRGDVA